MDVAIDHAARCRRRIRRSSSSQCREHLASLLPTTRQLGTVTPRSFSISLLGKRRRRRTERGLDAGLFRSHANLLDRRRIYQLLTEEEGRDRIEAAYGRPMLDKLAALKKKFDPDNLFRHTKSVAA